MVILTTLFGRYPKAKGKGSLSGLTLNTSTTETLTYANQQPATRCSSGDPVSSGALTGTLWSCSVGRVDEGQASVALGSGGVEIPSVVWVTHRVVWNRRRAFGLSLAVADLLTLVVLFGGDVL